MGHSRVSRVRSSIFSSGSSCLRLSEHSWLGVKSEAWVVVGAVVGAVGSANDELQAEEAEVEEEELEPEDEEMEPPTPVKTRAGPRASGKI